MVILLLFIGLIRASRAVPLDETTTCVVDVEETYYKRISSSERSFGIISDSAEYRFPNFNDVNNSQYPNSKLMNLIKIGDNVTLVYYEDNGLFGTVNKVVDCRSDNMVFRSYEAYKTSLEQGRIAAIILFVCVELAFICIVSLYLFVVYKYNL